MDLVQPRAQLLVATAHGYAKRTPLADFPAQRRYGSGVVAAQLSSSRHYCATGNQARRKY